MVDKLGRTGFAAVASLAWALPMAAWAGSVDLYPGPRPWIAFGIGLLLLACWLVLLRWVSKVPVAPRPRRLDLRAMSSVERRWNLVCAACLVGVLGWVNGAATVDWSILGRALASGGAGPYVFTGALLAALALLLAGAALSWRRADAAFRRRAATAPSA